MDSLFSFSTSNLMMELCGRAPPERMTSQLLRRLRRTSLSPSKNIHTRQPTQTRNNTIHAIKTHPKVSYIPPEPNTHSWFRLLFTYIRSLQPCVYNTAHLALPFSLSYIRRQHFTAWWRHFPSSENQYTTRTFTWITYSAWLGASVGRNDKKEKREKPRLSSSHFEKNYSTICWNEKKAGLIIFVWELLLLLYTLTTTS